MVVSTAVGQGLAERCFYTLTAPVKRAQAAAVSSAYPHPSLLSPLGRDCPGHRPGDRKEVSPHDTQNQLHTGAPSPCFLAGPSDHPSYHLVVRFSVPMPRSNLRNPWGSFSALIKVQSRVDWSLTPNSLS